MFAYDTTGNEAYVADAGGWTKLLNENSSVSAHADVNITGIADGYILQWSSAQARFNAVSSVSSAITIQEEGTPLTTAATTLNFVGSSVTASGSGSTKTITIASTTLSYATTTGTGDGTTTPIGSITSGFTVDEVLVSVNGVILEPTTDYTISGTTLTFVSAPVSGAELAVRYLDNTSGTYSTQAYTGDGTTTRTVTSGRSTDDLLVFVNGLMLVPGTDYTVSGTTLTFSTAPATGAEISIRYLRLT